MITENTFPQICSEIYEILNVLGKKYIDALPEKILKSIVEKRDLNYTNKFNINEGISKKNFSEDTINVLLGLDLTYWSSEAEKRQKIELYKKNEEKYQTEIHEKYNLDNLFPNKPIVNYESNNPVKELALIKEEKKSIFKKIFTFLRNIFKQKK